jgi:signal transduction histidine kinase
LIANALKFTYEGSIKVFLSYCQNTEFLKITVKDTGIGIRQQDREKLFKLFGKLESTATMNSTGIGLGLNICMKIIEELGGYLVLDEFDGVGSSFTLTIKCHE